MSGRWSDSGRLRRLTVTGGILIILAVGLIFGGRSAADALNGPPVGTDSKETPSAELRRSAESFAAALSHGDQSALQGMDPTAPPSVIDRYVELWGNRPLDVTGYFSGWITNPMRGQTWVLYREPCYQGGLKETSR